MDTRLDKIANGYADATVLAAATIDWDASWEGVGFEASLDRTCLQ